nr:hypothetical protein [Tanacetum cinerariifolium]
MYLEGDESTIHDIDFERMTVTRLSKMLQGTCMFPVKGIFFLVSSNELSDGLIQIKNDLDLANCITIGYKNGKVIDMFLKHHGYDLSHWIQTDIDNNDDEISDVEMEDITGYAVSDFVGEDDVVIPNRSINDLLLNKLCNGSYINDFSDKPDVGLRFEHPEQLKDCLTNYGVANRYQLWYRRNDYRSLFDLYGRDLTEGRSGGKKGKKEDWSYKKEKDEDELPKKDKGKLLRAPKKDGHKGAAASTVQHNFYSKMNLIGNIDPEAKQWLVDRNPNSWCRAFFKMDRGCPAYENGISKSYHNSIRIARGKPLITMLEEIRVYLMQRLYSMHNLAANLEDSITPSIRKEIERLKYSQRYWTVYPCERVNVITRSGRMMTCHNCWKNGHNKKGCNKEKQPKPTVEKRTPGRKKAGSNFVFQTCDKDGGDADPSSAGSSVGDPSSAGPSVADPSSAGPNPTDDVPTQQSKTSDTAKIIEDAIATGRLKTVGLKRRCKSERIAKRAKAFQFGKDGARSCPDKAWDVDDKRNDKICIHNHFISFHMQKRITFHTDGGDADPSSAGPSVGDPSSAGPSVGDPSSAGPSVADPSSAGPSVANPSSAGPSVADSSLAGTSVTDLAGSGSQTTIEDPIIADPTNDIPTQQSKTSDTAKIIEDVIATGRLKTAALKRRCKSERIAKRAKALQFGKDGTGSCPDKAWMWMMFL